MNITITEYLAIEEALQDAATTSYRQAAPQLIALGWIAAPEPKTEAQMTAEYERRMHAQRCFSMANVVTGARRNWKGNAR